LSPVAVGATLEAAAANHEAARIEAAMLYLVIAKDGTDAGAPARRQAVRERHLEGARALAERGTLHLGGAILDDAGGMVGSALVLEATDEAAVRALLETDVYARQGVWQHYEIFPFKRAI
jgi:uncharacterized protein YciI